MEEATFDRKPSSLAYGQAINKNTREHRITRRIAIGRSTDMNPLDLPPTSPLDNVRAFILLTPPTTLMPISLVDRHRPVVPANRYETRTWWRMLADPEVQHIIRQKCMSRRISHGSAIHSFESPCFTIDVETFDLALVCIQSNIWD